MKGAVCCSWYSCQFAGQCCIAEDASVEASVSCAAAGAVDGTDPGTVNGDGTFGEEIRLGWNGGDCGPGAPTCTHLGGSTGSKIEVGVTSPLDTERNKVRDYVKQLSIVS